jgi:O-antigen biosynthesis protein
MRPYIFAGDHYRGNSAGIRACHRLVHELNEHEQTAYYVLAAPVHVRAILNPEWNEIPLPTKGVEGAIVIYPEAVSGNPLGAERVVRWVLNTPGFIGGDEFYSDSELVFSWDKDYYAAPLLRVDIIEEFFNADDAEKDTLCAYMGKGERRGVAELGFTKGMTHITQEWPATRRELADLLRRTKTFYSYDDHTMLTHEASLCGCLSVLLPECTVLPLPDRPDYEGELRRFIELTQAM